MFKKVKKEFNQCSLCLFNSFYHAKFHYLKKQRYGYKTNKNFQKFDIFLLSLVSISFLHTSLLFFDYHAIPKTVITSTMNII